MKEVLVDNENEFCFLEVDKADDIRVAEVRKEAVERKVAAVKRLKGVRVLVKLHDKATKPYPGVNEFEAHIEDLKIKQNESPVVVFNQIKCRTESKLDGFSNFPVDIVGISYIAMIQVG